IRMVAAVESHEDALAVHAGDDGHRPAPYRLQVDERVLGIVDAQVDAVVTVGEEQLAAVLEVAVHHLDDGLPEVGELLEELALHLLELAVEDLPAVEAQAPPRSEEHTSELQSQSNIVCRLLLEKKKKTSG